MNATSSMANKKELLGEPGSSTVEHLYGKQKDVGSYPTWASAVVPFYWLFRSSSTPLANPQFLVKRWKKLRVSAARRLKWIDESRRNKTSRWWLILLLIIILGGLSSSGSLPFVPSSCTKFLLAVSAQTSSVVQNVAILTKDFIISDNWFSLFSVQRNNSTPLPAEISNAVKPSQESQLVPMNVSLLSELLEKERMLLMHLNRLDAALQDIGKKEYLLRQLADQIRELKTRFTQQPCHRFYREQFDLEHMLREAVSTHLNARWATMLSEVQDDLKSLSAAALKELDVSHLKESAIREIIAEAIRLYDADRTGKADYALESAGGRVVSTRCTVPYNKDSKPAAAIRPGRALGECFSFQGEGRLVLELSHSIHVTGCSIEHIPRSIHPFGVTSSAPKHFSLLGLSNPEDDHPHLLGTYQYLIDTEEVVQYFPVQQNFEGSFKFVELVIESNHGNVNYTCLYRIRIHGHIA